MECNSIEVTQAQLDALPEREKGSTLAIEGKIEKQLCDNGKQYWCYVGGKNIGVFYVPTPEVSFQEAFEAKEKAHAEELRKLRIKAERQRQDWRNQPKRKGLPFTKPKTRKRQRRAGK